MKKFVLFATGILLFLSTFTASATAKSPDEILPDSVNLYIKADPSNINEVFESYYTDMIESLVTDGMFYTSYYYEDVDPEQEEAAENLAENLAEIFSSNTLYFALEMEQNIDGWLEEEIISFLFEISEDEYETKVLTDYIVENSDITELNGVSIYAPDDVDGAIAYYEGYFLFADTPESIGNIINATTTLSENSDYNDISDKFLTNNFFELYVGNIRVFLDEFSDDFYETMVSLSAFESVGFSMKENSSGYEFQSYVNQDSEVLSELNIDYDDMDPLSLHEFMPKLKPLFYTAKNSNADMISMMKNSYDYDFIAQEIADELHIDLDEFVFALENETAFLIQDSGEFFPTITVLTQLDDNLDSLEEQISQLGESTWESIQEDADRQTGDTVFFDESDSTVSVSKGTVDVDGATLDQFTVKIRPDLRENPYALILDPDLLEFKITLGVTNDDILLISSNKDIDSDYKEGLQNNSDLEDLFGETTDAVSFLSISQINKYLQSTLTDLEEYLPEEFNELQETKSVIETLLEPWDLLKGTDTYTNDYIESEATILANIDEIISNYDIEKLEKDFDASSKEDGAGLIFNTPEDFDDVDTDEWYGDNVYYLNTKGIVDGHPDGTYKPSDTLNRAEFIKLVAETLEKEGFMETIPYYGTTPYSDVQSYEWYSGHIEALYNEGLLDGLWDDTTLNANQDMTRIETAQLLSNVLNKYSISATEQNDDEFKFIDVSSDDKEAIESVFLNNIMIGTSSTSFSPSKVLNRAEAASIVRNLLNIL